MLWKPAWNNFFNFIPGFNSKTKLNKLVCLSFDSTGIYIAYVLHHEPPQLQWCEFIPYAQAEDLAATLTTVVNKYSLQNAPCSWLLNSDDYKLLTLEALPVPPAEMHTALRWHIKDLISFPVEECILEVFPAPFSLALGKPNNIQVIAANRNNLQKIADTINNCGLKLINIDIPELALRNITALVGEDKLGVGLVWIQPSHSKLVVTKNKNLYITREFDLALNELFDSSPALSEEAEKKIGLLASEIQRSLSYYQSQLRQTTLAKLLITSINPIVLTHMEPILFTPLQYFNLSSVLNFLQPISDELQTQCLAVIGGALRKEAAHDSTN